MSDLDPAAIRLRLNRSGEHKWEQPRRFGPLGFIFETEYGQDRARIIVSDGPEPDDESDDPSLYWRHASIARDHMPSYADLVMMHKAIWPEGFAYQVFADASEHVNIHSFALHLWGYPDGRAILPNFGKFGSI